MADDNKPEGYYDEIDYPFERKDEVAALFTDYTIIEHTSVEKEYDHLEDNDVVLEIVNPHRSENLFVELAGEFTLFFSSWHSHYAPYEYDFLEMKKDAMAIINGEIGVLCFYINNKWFGCNLLTDEISHLTDPMALVRKMRFPEEHIQKIRNNGVIIYADYWKPSDCYEFELEKDSMEGNEYSFPRRGGVRFVIKAGKCYGSASQRKLSDDTAIITYVYLDESEDNINLRKHLIYLLEEDARKTGARKVFVSIEKSEYDLFLSLNYSETTKLDIATVEKLYGAIIEFDTAMIKSL